MIRLPVITGIIRRRLLLNYRVKPEVVARQLPGNFRPKLVGGHAVAGICLIRLEQIRPKGLPEWLGISSENAAHRIAVEWEDSAGALREGVYVPRRDTDSRLNALAGGRIFPGTHHHSHFDVVDEAGHISMTIRADDGTAPLIQIDATESDKFPTGSVFGSLAESSRFFENGCVGYSPRPDHRTLDGLLLKVAGWRVSPLAVGEVRSVYFDDPSLFPPGSVEFDHALLMRDIPHEWHAEPEMRMELGATAGSPLVDHRSRAFFRVADEDGEACDR